MNSEVSGRAQSFGLPPEAGGPAASTASAKENNSAALSRFVAKFRFTEHHDIELHAELVAYTLSIYLLAFLAGLSSPHHQLPAGLSWNPFWPSEHPWVLLSPLARSWLRASRVTLAWNKGSGTQY